MSELVEKVSRPVTVEPDTMYRQIGVRSHCRGLFDKEKVSGKSLGNKRVFWVVPDCFVVNIVFAWEQAVGRTTSADVDKIASHRFPMYRPLPDEADLNYLVYFFSTEYGKHLLGLASPGGAGRNKTLGQSSFLDLEIPIPPVNEQIRIAEILGTWDHAIQSTEKLIAASKVQKSCLMQQLLTGQRRLPGFGEKWRDAQLSELGIFLKGAGVSRSDVTSTGLPAVRYGEIYTTHHFVIESFHSFISADAASCSLRMEQGDILFTCSGETAEEIGKSVAYLHEIEAYAGGDIILLRGHGQSARFLGYALNSADVVRQKTRFGQGNSVVHINAGNLSEIVVSLPPVDEQDAIASVLQTAQRDIQQLTELLQRLKTEKTALMQQLLTGKRRVRATEMTT